jgi:hypothetical protein
VSRVSSHVEGGYLVLSTWRDDACVSTVRLSPDEAAELVAVSPRAGPAGRAGPHGCGHGPPHDRVRLPAGEPAAGPWRGAGRRAAGIVLAAAGDPAGRPRIVAVDGRGASGTSTLAARLHRQAPASAVVHTDDVAWHEPLHGLVEIAAPPGRLD